MANRLLLLNRHFKVIGVLAPSPARLAKTRSSPRSGRHSAWVVGEESVVGFEFGSRTVEEYAKG